MTPLIAPVGTEASERSSLVVDYEKFLRKKFDFRRDFGFKIDPADLSPILKPHQADIVLWAIAGGRRALFESFGLGKSLQQLEIMRLILAREQCRCLIVCPLGVRQEFTRDARDLLGIAVTFVRRSEEVGSPGIYLTNYESVRDERLDPTLFDAVSLDEASVLRSFGSKTYQSFLGLFAHTKYRFVATATPSPNRYKELIHYAAFLGIMDSGQALTRFFQRDSEHANNLTLYSHKEAEFFLWLHSWAIFLQRPSELGHSDEGYDLPPIEVRWHEVPALTGDGGVDRDGQHRMFRDATLGVSQAAREKRETLDIRITRLMEIMNAYVSGAAQGVPQGVLPPESGAVVGSAEGADSPQERGGSDGVAGVPQEVLGSQSRAITPRAEGEGSAELPGEAGGVPSAAATGAAQVVRSDRSGVWPDAGGAGGLLPDLPNADDPAGRGPRSRDGSGTGTTVPALQHGPRALQGGSSDPQPSDRVRDQVVIWCELNAEQRAVERALRECGLTFSSIDGSMSVEEAERRLEEWRDRRTYALIGKPVMLGEGLNLQQCNKAIFLGVSFKFNSVFQSVHRIQRYGQERQCEVHFIYAESEREVVKILRRKWAQHEELTERMSKVIRDHGLNQLSVAEVLGRSLGVERVEASGQGWQVACNDCVLETVSMETESVDEIVTSIPFSNHYEYTPQYEDFGHTDDNGHFWAQMDFLTPQLFRVIRPGRVYCCHVKDRVNFGNVTGDGFSTVSPFHAEAIMHGIKHGFRYMGMITVVTDVVRENNQSYRLGWSENAKDGSKMGVGSPEYVLLFRKPQSDPTRGYADVPVVKDKADYTRSRWQVDAHAFWRSNGNRPLAPEDLEGLTTSQRMKLFGDWTLNHVYDYEVHVKCGEALETVGQLPAHFMALRPASPHPDVWTDVVHMRTLNMEQSRRRQANHVCPLAYDIVDRLIVRYSNPGELVYDPFGGLFTVAVRALRAGRKACSVELFDEYFVNGVRYLQVEERGLNAPTLFDLNDMTGESLATDEAEAAGSL